MSIKKLQVHTLRDFKNMNKAVASLKQVSLIPEVQHALITWIKAQVNDVDMVGVLVGGLALSFYIRPRTTDDIDLLFLSETSIPKSVVGFKKTRKGAFQENQTHVIVETCYPHSIKIPEALAEKVFKTAINHEGLKVASRAGLVALKLYGANEPRRELKDLADVVSLVEGHIGLNMEGWFLTKTHFKKLKDCIARVS